MLAFLSAVQHTHADAALALTNTVDGEQRVRALWGNSVVVVPYVMPGFDLALTCAGVREAGFVRHRCDDPHESWRFHFRRDH